MIIALTIRDNDFSELFEKYLKNFRKNITLDLTDQRDKELAKTNQLADCRDIFLNCEKTLKNVEYLLNPNNDLNYTKERLDFLESRIRTSFEYFTTHYLTVVDGNTDDLSYVMKNLSITFPDYLIDKWENGEKFYYLLHSGVVVNQ